MEYVRPKVERLCKFMDEQYEMNVQKLKKQREEQRK
jgi:hypothetical protein